MRISIFPSEKNQISFYLNIDTFALAVSVGWLWPWVLMGFSSTLSMGSETIQSFYFRIPFTDSRLSNLVPFFSVFFASNTRTAKEKQPRTKCNGNNKTTRSYLICKETRNNHKISFEVEFKSCYTFGKFLFVREGSAYRGRKSIGKLIKIRFIQMRLTWKAKYSLSFLWKGEMRASDSWVNRHYIKVFTHIFNRGVMS